MPSEAALGKNEVKEKDLACPSCKKEMYARDGWYHGKHGKRQRYECICKRRFGGNLYFEYSQTPRTPGMMPRRGSSSDIRPAPAGLQKNRTKTHPDGPDLGLRAPPVWTAVIGA